MKEVAELLFRLLFFLIIPGLIWAAIISTFTVMTVSTFIMMPFLIFIVVMFLIFIVMILLMKVSSTVMVSLRSAQNLNVFRNWFFFTPEVLFFPLFVNADSSCLVSNPIRFVISHTTSVETTDFVVVHVLLEEESFTVLFHLVTFLLAVLDSSFVIAMSAIDWVSVTNTVFSATICQVNLIVGWAIIHEVD